ncbi:MAG: ParB/RepB/Spo0J family partition protein [Verrucomicrobia bacterium]|nr:ParB/RepB/Spo0J family partition protein [Verrucomicrobiota bacterium]
MAKPVLGRGLGALLGGAPIPHKPPAASFTAPAASSETATDSRERVERVPLARVHPSALQPRKDFPIEALQELAASIKEQGIIQPLIVRPRGEDYELIAGERRWRASQMIGLAEVPVIVRDSDDRTVLEWMLIENLQRENLNPIEEALGYQELIEQFQLTQEEAAQKVGRSRAGVANALRLLKLAPELQLSVREGRLSVGHAKVMLALANFPDQLEAARIISRDGLNVRKTEELVDRLQHRATAPAGEKHAANGSRSWNRDAHLVDVENRLQQRLGTKVALRYRQGKGAVEIKFFSDDELERILQIVGVQLD